VPSSASTRRVSTRTPRSAQRGALRVVGHHRTVREQRDVGAPVGKEQRLVQLSSLVASTPSRRSATS
jgi:hypothetical protein